MVGPTCLGGKELGCFVVMVVVGLTCEAGFAADVVRKTSLGMPRLWYSASSFMQLFHEWKIFPSVSIWRYFDSSQRNEGFSRKCSHSVYLSLNTMHAGEDQNH